MKFVLLLIASVCLTYEATCFDVQVGLTIDITKDDLGELLEELTSKNLRTNPEETIFKLLNRFQHDKRQEAKKRKQTAKPPPPEMPMPPRDWLLDANRTRDFIMKKFDIFIAKILRKNVTRGDPRPARVIDMMRQQYYREFNEAYLRLESFLTLDYFEISLEWLDYVQRADNMFSSFGMNYITHFVNMMPIRNKGKWGIIHHYGRPTLRSEYRRKLTGYMCRDFKVCQNYKLFTEYFLDWLGILLKRSAKRKDFLNAITEPIKQLAQKLLEKEVKDTFIEYLDAMSKLDDEVIKNVFDMIRDTVKHRDVEDTMFDNKTIVLRRVLLVISKAYLHNEVDLASFDQLLVRWSEGQENIKEIIDNEVRNCKVFYFKWNTAERNLFERDINELMKYVFKENIDKYIANKLGQYSSVEYGYSDIE